MKYFLLPFSPTKTERHDFSFLHTGRAARAGGPLHSLCKMRCVYNAALVGQIRFMVPIVCAS